MEDKFSSLDPTLVRAWAKAGVESYTIGPLDKREAQALRHRLYTTRARMRRLSHPDTNLANRAAISIRSYSETQAMLYLGPANAVVEHALAEAGIAEPEPEPPPLD